MSVASEWESVSKEHKVGVGRLVVALGVVVVVSGCSSMAIPDVVTPVKRVLEPLGRSFDSRSTYIVQPGDNLAYIAWRYKTSVDDLLAWNGMASASALISGQPLQVRPPRGATAIVQAPVLIEPTVQPVPQAAVSDTVTRAAGAASPLDSQLIVPMSPRADALADVPNDVARSEMPAVVAVEPLVVPALPVAVQPIEAAQEPAEVAALNVEDVIEVPTASRDGLNWAWPQRGKIVKSFSASENSQQGIDIVGGASEPIRAAADGIVAFAGSDVNVLGRTIIIDHAGEYLSAYAKVGKLLVGEGDSVRVGEVIAQAGDGSADGRFHFQIRQRGVPLDPLKYLPKGN